VWTVTISGGASCPVPGTPILALPANGSSTGDTTPEFRWNPASDASEYRVQVDNNADFSSPEKNFVTAQVAYTLAVPLPPGTYYWRVLAHHTANGCDTWSTWSAAWMVTIATAAAPPVPATPTPATND
jgi:hypothetical protein